MYCVGVALKVTQCLNHMYCPLINCMLSRLSYMSLDSSVGTVRKVGLYVKRKLVRF